MHSCSRWSCQWWLQCILGIALHSTATCTCSVHVLAVQCCHRAASSIPCECVARTTRKGQPIDLSNGCQVGHSVALQHTKGTARIFIRLQQRRAEMLVTQRRARRIIHAREWLPINKPRTVFQCKPRAEPTFWTCFRNLKPPQKQRTLAYGNQLAEKYIQNFPCMQDKAGHPT